MIRDRIKNSQRSFYSNTDESLAANLDEVSSIYSDEYFVNDPVNDETIFYSKASGRKKKLSFDDFNLEKLVGQGAFGKVFLVSTKTKNPEFYAMKALKKDNILCNNEIESTVLERDVSKLGNKNPYLTKLLASFQNDVNIFFKFNMWTL